MRRASYRFGVAWIAHTDECGHNDTDLQAVSETVPVLLLADLFGVEPLRVARDVIRLRTVPVNR